MKKYTMLRLGLYKHFKGNMYEVVNIATHSETREKHVVYRALYGDYGLFIRPLEMFLEKVEFEGKIVDRFEFVCN